MESQEIDRLLQCISEYYHTVRWCSTSVNSSDIFSSTNDHQLKSLPAPPITLDQLSLIFYAILLLQTSLHNVNAAKSSLGKQTVSQFIKNVYGKYNLSVDLCIFVKSCQLLVSSNSLL